MKHSLAHTSLGKAYAWGWGGYGQLGNGRFNNVCEPQLIDAESVVQVQAAYKTSLLLLDHKSVLWCGSNNTISYQSTFTVFKIQAKVCISFIYLFT